MSRFIVFTALLGLTACGGPLPAGEAESTPDEVSAEAQCSSGNAWECACAKNKTQTTCQQSASRCVWSVNRCLPTYE